MDIKPGNIFRFVKHDNSLTYKIGDLGLVCPSSERIYDEGDCRYVARELIENMQLGSSGVEIFWLENVFLWSMGL